jgi:hypothetical protein
MEKRKFVQHEMFTPRQLYGVELPAGQGSTIRVLNEYVVERNGVALRFQKYYGPHGRGHSKCNECWLTPSLCRNVRCCAADRNDRVDGIFVKGL